MEKMKRPEPPKDENGNPLPPPDGKKPPKDGKRPEPPKDENGNPLPPPDGKRPPRNSRTDSEE